MALACATHRRQPDHDLPRQSAKSTLAPDVTPAQTIRFGSNGTDPPWRDVEAPAATGVILTTQPCCRIHCSAAVSTQTLMNSDNILKLMPTKTEVATAIPSERVYALTTSTQFPNDELASSRNSSQRDARAYRRRGYFVPSPRSVIDRLKAAAIEFVSIAILIVGFIVAVLCGLDLMDMLRW